MPAATASGADAKPNGDAKSRDHNQGNQDRKYTVEQKAAVIRVRRCSPTAFYDILGLEEVKATVTDNEIKKAYRKLSLLTHPDKNGHEHADEAFKMVSRAFGVLSDPDKKQKFDRYGGDPDSRFGGASAPSQSPFSGRGGGGVGPMGGGGGWGDEEISPEEMFNRFFGGGMGGGFGPFGTSGFDHGSTFGQAIPLGSPFGRPTSFGGGSPLYWGRPSDRSNPFVGGGLFNSTSPFNWPSPFDRNAPFDANRIFAEHDRWHAQAHREHDEMFRQFFH
jgi:DnaJ family protein B protein 12